MAINIIRRRSLKISSVAAEILPLLEEDLRKTNGKPYNCGWKNFGPLRQLGDNVFHCHLNKRHVAIWNITEENGDIIIEIIYAGTREKAPY